MGCSMLNFLYQLDILLAKICFIYKLKLGTGSPKTKAKGVVLVRGMWYETLDSLGFPYDVNQSLTFPS